MDEIDYTMDHTTRMNYKFMKPNTWMNVKVDKNEFHQ